MSSSARPAAQSLSVSPVINYPREAETGETYLLTIDLAPRQSFETWPYTADEEVAIYCLVNAEPLFIAEPLGEPAVVIHRFGGTYGPARFLITAAAKPQEGVIQIKLVSGMGVPLTSFETPVINIRDKVERKEVVDFFVRSRPAATGEAAELPADEVPPRRRPGKPAVIFLSSTVEDLREYRQAITRSIKRMGHEVLHSDPESASEQFMLEYIDEALATCDLYVGIFAWRYGFIPQTDNPEQLSVTELEYRRAVAKGLPTFIFMLDETAAWPVSQIEMAGLEKIRAFRLELSSKHAVNFFSDEAGLVTQLTKVLADWAGRRRPHRGNRLASPLPSSSVALQNLPATSDLMVGREQELETLDEVWGDPDIRVVNVVGWGGSGKSTLVKRWLAQMAEDNFRGAHRVYAWSFYAEGTGDKAGSADLFIHAALQWFGDPDPSAGSPYDKGRRLARLVGAECALMVLDGLESLQYSPDSSEVGLKDAALNAFLRQLAVQNVGLCLLTSRYPVADLAGFQTGTFVLNLEELSPQEGAELLKTLGVIGSQQEMEEASREFNGHPLSLTLLGSYLINVFSGDISRRGELSGLEDDELSGGAALRMMTSYERWLGEGPELDVLRMLGLSDGTLYPAAAQALRATPPIKGLTDRLVGLSEQRWQQVLSRLQRAGLISMPPADPGVRLVTHPLVREHFGRQLKQLHPDAWREGNRRLYEHYKNTALEFPDTLQEMAPLYLAVKHGCAAGMNQEVVDEVYHKRILRGDQLYHQRQLGAYAQDLNLLSNFFGHPWSQVVSELKVSSQMLVLTLAGSDFRALGRLREAIEPMQAVLRLALSRERRIDIAHAAMNLSQAYLICGDLQQARELAQHAVESAMRVDDPYLKPDAYLESDARATLAHALHQAGRIAEADALFREAEKMRLTVNTQYSLLDSPHGFHFCDVLLDEGLYQEATSLAEQMLERALKQNRLLNSALGHLSLGRAYLLQSRLEAKDSFIAAASNLDRAVRTLRQVGEQQYLPYGLLACAELYRVTGDFARAQYELGEAFSIAARGGMGLLEADCQLELARLHLERGESGAAREALALAREMIERISYHRRDRDLQEIGRELEERSPVPEAAGSVNEAAARPASTSLTIIPIFVSSTWLDLEPERRAVEQAVNRLRETKFVGMEYFGSRDETTRQASLDDIDRSRIYVCIVAGRYGSGITEAEYERASERGLPRFIYFKDEAIIPDEWCEKDPAQAAKLDAFRKKLREHHLEGFDFKSPDDLAAKVTADLHRWLFDEYLTPKLRGALGGEVPREEAQALLDAVKDLSDLNRDLVTRLQGAGFNVAGEVDFVRPDNFTNIYNLPFSAPPIPTLHQLRAPVGDFVGREKEIADLLAALRRGGSAVIAGMGGIGKTELALYVAKELRDTYTDAQLVLDMRGTDEHPRDPADALAACIRAFLGPEQRLPDDVHELTRVYRSVLEGKRALILLDNAADSAQVRPFLPLAGSALLITSRSTISLPGINRITLDQLSPDEARVLLLGIAPRVMPDVADQICFLCGYLPLAVRAAGSLLDVTADLDPADYAVQLRDERRRGALIGVEGVDLGVEASFGLSYARLAPDAARVFRLLAVFPASFDARAEEAICEDPDHKHLSELLRRNLVGYNADTRRYSLHNLARLFADSRMGDDERLATRMRHAAHYLIVLKECGDFYLKGGDAIKSGIALFDVERRNIEAGQEWAHRHASGDERAARLCNQYPTAGVYVLYLRQHPREFISWHEAALAAARQLKDRAAEGAHLGNLGIAYAELGEMHRAIEFNEQRLSIAREIGDRLGEGNALGSLGYAYAALGETRRAVQFHEQSLLVAREIGDRRGEAIALSYLGSNYTALGEHRRAIEFSEMSVVVARELGDRRNEGRALGNLGIAYSTLGETQRAVELYEQCLSIAREIGDRRVEGDVLFNLGLALDELGRRAQAIAHAEAALEILEQIESPQSARVREKLSQWRSSAE